MIYFQFIPSLVFIATAFSLVEVIRSDEDYENEIPVNPDDLDVATTHRQYEKDSRREEDFDFDSFFGSYQDVDDFKELEPQESKRRLGILFNTMDENKDGNMSKTELSSWLIQLLEKLDAERSGVKFIEMDENNDRNISLSEFLTKSYGHTLEEVEEMRKSKSNEWKLFLENIFANTQKFHLADKNNDTLLDLHEFIRFTNPENYIEMAPYLFNRTILLYDKNKDGFIDLEEYLGEEILDNETEIHEKNLFKSFDNNNNGLLDKEEIFLWSAPGFHKSTTTEVEHLFNKTDVNKDNQLSKEEMINQHELWLGSRATDYGKYLDNMKIHDEL